MTIKRNFSDAVHFEAVLEAYVESKIEELMIHGEEECYNSNIADTPCESEVNA